MLEAAVASAIASCSPRPTTDDAFRDDLIGTLAEGNRLRDAVKTAQQYVPPVPITAPTGTRSPRLVLGGAAAAAAPPRIRRFLSDTHANSAVVATRRDFLRRSFLQLRGDRNWCIDATRRVTRATMHDVYGRPTPRDAPLIDEVGLRQFRLRGDRATRGLPALADIAGMDPCCNRGCCGGGVAAERTTHAARKQLWEAAEATNSNTVAENDVLLGALWCRGLGRTNSLCNEYFWRVGGFAPGRCSRVRALSVAYDGVLAAALDEHGNTGRRPANATSCSTVARLETVIAKYTRPDPTRGYLICCNEMYNGTEGLLRAMALEQHEAFESIHEETARRIIEHYISRFVKPSIRRRGERRIARREAVASLFARGAVARGVQSCAHALLARLWRVGGLQGLGDLVA